MFPGAPAGLAAGNTRDMILSLTGTIVGSQAYIVLKPWDYYRGRYWTLWINGRWIGKNFFVRATGDVIISVPFDPGTTIGSIWACEVGQWATFDADSIPSQEIELEEQGNARRLVIQWKNSYALSTIYGSTQLSGLTITGARRGRNVAAVSGFPSRGRLTFSILGNVPIASDRIVRWYAGDVLVAEGYRNGDGALTCSAKNNSGLTITCTVTYTGDVRAGVAYVDCKWPASYPIHYSTSALAYPRTPETTIYDNGNDEYFYLAPPDLAGGSYNYNVLQIDDEGQTQTVIVAPTDSPKTINTPPAAPTITSVTGNIAAITVNFTNGVAGCTYTAYYSPVNEPINYGSRATPAPVGPSAVDATSIVLPALAAPGGIDFTAAYATLVGSFDAAINASNAVFLAGETGFLTALTTLQTALNAAVDVWSAALGKSLDKEKESIAQGISLVTAGENSVSSFALATSSWQDYVGYYYSGLLLYIGSILEGRSGRYYLPGGQVPGTAAGTGSVTGTAADGSSGSGMTFANSLKAAGQPFVRASYIRIVVRATKGGLEEHTDTEYLYELNAAGVGQAPRPNAAQMKPPTFSGGLVSATIGVLEQGARVAASFVDFYVVPAGTTITPGVTAAAGIAGLSAALGNYHEITVFYAMPGAGWYDFAACARSAAGVRSDLSPIRTLEYSVTVPVAVSTVSAKVIRGRAVRPEEV